METAEYELLAQSLAESGVFEGIAESVTSVLALPSDLETVFTECGEANAFYFDGRITMCYEYLDFFTESFLATADDPLVSKVEYAGMRCRECGATYAGGKPP